MVATINHESRGKLFAHCLLICQLERGIILIVHAIVSFHICEDGLHDATLLLTLLLSPKGSDTITLENVAELLP